MTLLATLRELTALPGPSGAEREVALAFAKHLRAVTDEVTLDPFGNVVGTLRGDNAQAALMISAHTDEVGLIVKYVEADGGLRVDLNGLIDERVTLATPVDVWARRGPLAGVVGARSRHHLTPEELARPLDTMDLWVHVGAASADEARALGVRIGDLITFKPNFQELAGGWVASKALDDRAGLAVVLEALRDLPRRNFDIHVVGAAQEEVGSRGARVAAQTLRPHVAISVDTVAGAEPGTPRARATQVCGGGPVLRAWEWMSGSMTGTAYDRRLFERAQDLADAAGVPHQLDIARTWTDACGIAPTGHGVPTAGLYIPRRCAHSPCELAKLSDLEQAVRLLQALLAGLDGRELRELASPTRL
ncbi:MAG: M42 family metallopeptidase [Candidatus Rokubacteria bacterium]|nr:M42 family metallopeptidase [Candidatus Rokubacteria bacterium]